MVLMLEQCWTNDAKISALLSLSWGNFSVTNLYLLNITRIKREILIFVNLAFNLCVLTCFRQDSATRGPLFLFPHLPIIYVEVTGKVIWFERGRRSLGRLEKAMNRFFWRKRREVARSGWRTGLKDAGQGWSGLAGVS